MSRRQGRVPDWDKYDWTRMTDAEIGRAAGRSRERVRQVRQDPSCPRPRCVRWHQRVGTSKEKIARLPAELTRRKTREDVARLAGCDALYAEQCLRECGLPYVQPPDLRRRTKYRWESVSPEQWQSMTDKQVARMLGVRNCGVVSQWRRRKGILKEVRMAVVAG